MRLDGKVALITGGARGQGAAEARLFAQEGAKVVIADVLDPDGMAVAAEINELGGDATFVHLDVSSESEWQQAIEAAVSAYGKLDVLVNNAAIWRGGHVLETTVEQWDVILDINAKGVFLGTKLAIPEMRKAGGGSGPLSTYPPPPVWWAAGRARPTAPLRGQCACSPSRLRCSTGQRAFEPTPYIRGPSTLRWGTRCGPTREAGRRPSSARC